MEKANYPIIVLCRVLKVARQGYYKWQKKQVEDSASFREIENQELAEKIKQIDAQHKGRYGVRRIHAQLRTEGFRVNLKRVYRIMKTLGLQGIHPNKPKKGTTVRAKDRKPAKDLVQRNFTPDKPNDLWVSDIMEFKTLEGKLYLASVLDCYSRMNVGFKVDDNIEATLVTDALRMAISHRKPPPGLIHHSDQGSQYTSQAVSTLCGVHKISLSMGEKGDCFDNAVSESLNKTIKTELINQQVWQTKEQAKQAIFEYINVYYNRKRYHSTLNYHTPHEYEILSEQTTKTTPTAQITTVNN